MPLYLRILLLFLLNVGLLFGALAWAAHRQMQSGLQSFLGAMVGFNLQKAAEAMHGDLGKKPREEWPAHLAKFEKTHGVHAALFRQPEEYLMGSVQTLPSEVSAGLFPRLGGDSRRPGRGPPGMGPPGRRSDSPPPMRRIPAASPTSGGRDFAKGLIRTGKPPRYWAVASLPPISREGEGRGDRLVLAIVTESVLTCSLLFDSRPWLLGFGAALFLSCLIWSPFVRGITAKLREMKQATKEMAAGRLSVRIRENRKDEIGQLATSVNLMAAQLEVFVNGQRRFTRDVAHELCSPISRMQAAVGVMDTSALPQRARQYVDALDSELQHMSRLVQELLQFAKASHTQDHLLSEVVLDPVVQAAIDRECGPDGVSRVEVNVPNDLVVTAEPVLLERAIGNVLRNSLRYAGEDARIEIAAAPGVGDDIVLTIADTGPGVPEESFARLFEPFYRPDEARSPEQGGTGLGLAIVKHCIQACHGSVAATKHSPHGLSITMRLRRAG